MFEENKPDNSDSQIRWLVYGFYQRLMSSEKCQVKYVKNRSAIIYIFKSCHAELIVEKK